MFIRQGCIIEAVIEPQEAKFLGQGEVEKYWKQVESIIILLALLSLACIDWLTHLLFFYFEALLFG